MNTEQIFYPNSVEPFKKLLSQVGGKKFAVVGHLRPDGDCVASQLAMAWILRRFGASEVVCLNKNEVPYLYENFLCGERFLSTEDFDAKGFEIITVDCADYARTSETFKAKNPKVLACIDHHFTNAPYADITILEPTSCATAALISSLMFACGIDFPEHIANALFMGIMMDTRQLTTSNSDYAAFEISSKLVKKGANPSYVSMQLYQRENLAKMKLLSEFLNSLTLHFGGRVCIGTLTQDVFAKTGAKKEDTDGLVDFARNIEGVDIALVIEVLQGGKIKGSLRAKNPEVKVNEIAQIFGGGGHLAAAGFTAENISYDEFYAQFLTYAESQLRKYDAKTL